MKNETVFQKNKLNARQKNLLKKELIRTRLYTADWASFFGLIGFILMIFESEFTLYGFYTKDSIYSLTIKSLISISTLPLVILIFIYNSIQTKIFMLENSIEDWRITITFRRTLKTLAELVVCVIHPIPGNISFVWTLTPVNKSEEVSSNVPIDLVLSLPMFLRIYLLCRSMLLHSTIFSNVSSRSIGALNKVDLNASYILKTLMTIYPGTVLLVVHIVLFASSSWTLRACESNHDERFINFANSLWAISVTFLTIGYGDIVPNTHCGRAISIIVGFMGVFCTAIMIAVMAQKLQLSKSEEYVHNFITDNKLKKRLKNTAAQVIQESWYVYKFSKIKKNSVRVRNHQRKLIKRVEKLKEIKQAQKDLNDDSDSKKFFELSNTQKEAYDIVCEINKNQKNCEIKIRELEDRVALLQNSWIQSTSYLECIQQQNRLLIDRFDSFLQEQFLTLTNDKEPSNNGIIFKI